MGVDGGGGREGVWMRGGEGRVCGCGCGPTVGEGEGLGVWLPSTCDQPVPLLLIR